MFINIALWINYHFLKLNARCCWKYYHNSSKLRKSYTCCHWRCCRNNLHLKVVVGICECCLMRITHGILMFLVCCIDHTPPRHNLWKFDTKLYFVLEGGRAASSQKIKKINYKGVPKHHILCIYKNNWNEKTKAFYNHLYFTIIQYKEKYIKKINQRILIFL